MKNRVWKLQGVLAGACLYAFATPALAQDKPVKADPGESDREAAAKTMPTWESFGEGEAETLEETFFRLSRDFVTTSDQGVRRLGSVPIWPRGEVKFFGMRLLPFLRQAAEWDHNFYVQPSTGTPAGSHDKQHQWTHVTEAGILADTSLMGGRLHIACSIDSIWNVRYGSEAPADTWDVDSQLGATYRMPSGAWVSGGLFFQRRNDPSDFPLVNDNFQRTSTRSFLNFGFDRDIFFGSKLQFEFGISRNNEQADDEAFSDFDRQETTAHAKVSYPFLKDTTRIFGLLTYRFDNRESDAINDGETFGFNLGLEGSIPLSQGDYRGLRGQISVGFTSALYEDDTYKRGSKTFVADSDREANELNVQVALQYLISPKTSADLRYLHGTQFSFEGNYQVVDRVDFSFSHNFSRQLTGRIDAYAEHTDPSGKSPPETIPPGSEPSHDARNVNRLGAGVGLRYAINEWADVDISAEVENRNEARENSFRNYRGILGITFYLNALMPKAKTAAQP